MLAQWKLRVLTTELPEKSLLLVLRWLGWFALFLSVSLCYPRFSGGKEKDKYAK